MKRARHREIRELARHWTRRGWYFENTAEAVGDEYAAAYLYIGGLCWQIVDLHRQAARFEIGEYEAAEAAERLIRAYDAAFRRLPHKRQRECTELVATRWPVCGI